MKRNIRVGDVVKPNGKYGQMASYSLWPKIVERLDPAPKYTGGKFVITISSSGMEQGFYINGLEISGNIIEQETLKP